MGTEVQVTRRNCPGLGRAPHAVRKRPLRLLFLIPLKKDPKSLYSGGPSQRPTDPGAAAKKLRDECEVGTKIIRVAERTDARRIFAGNLLPALRKKKITQAAASLSRLENAPINGAVGEEEEEEEEDRLDIGQIRGWGERAGSDWNG